MKKQTAVEWLVTELNSEINYIPIVQWDRIRDLVQRAKAMEREQIIEAFGIGCQVESKRLIGYHDMAEQHYFETYGNHNGDVNKMVGGQDEKML